MPSLSYSKEATFKMSKKTYNTSLLLLFWRSVAYLGENDRNHESFSSAYDRMYFSGGWR